jgi:hypothetical protein
MAKAKQKDDRDTLEIQIEGNVRTLRERGLADPNVYDLHALLQVAGTLSQTGTDREKIEAALTLAIGDYHDAAKIETVHLWLGLHPQTQNTRGLTSEEQLTIAWKYARAHDPKENRAREGFRTNGGRERFRYLAKRLFLRYTAATAEPTVGPPDADRSRDNGTATTAPQGSQREPALAADSALPLTQKPDTGRLGSLRRWLLASSLLGSVVAVLVLTIIGAWSAGSASAPLPSLAHLRAESNRHLTGSQAPVPDTGPTRQLGFGDPSPKGRTTYRNVRYGHVQGYVAPSLPTFDSVVNGLVEPNDELKFLGVRASPLTDGRQVDPYNGRVALARPSDLLWLNILIDNNAEVTPHCGLTGTVMHVWNSVFGTHPTAIFILFALGLLLRTQRHAGLQMRSPSQLPSPRRSNSIAQLAESHLG